MALGGWKTERMMRHYAAVTDAILRAAAEAVGGSAPNGWYPNTHGLPGLEGASETKRWSRNLSPRG
jgi:hypothetical protein